MERLTLIAGHVFPRRLPGSGAVRYLACGASACSPGSEVVKPRADSAGDSSVRTGKARHLGPRGKTAWSRRFAPITRLVHIQHPVAWLRHDHRAVCHARPLLPLGHRRRPARRRIPETGRAARRQGFGSVISASGRPAELTHPAHPAGGRLRVVAELLRHPAGAATDAELLHSAVDCLATMSAVEESDGCSADAKSASHLMIVFIAWVLSSAAAAAMR